MPSRQPQRRPRRVRQPHRPGRSATTVRAPIKISVDQFVAKKLVASGINRPIASLLLGANTNESGGLAQFYGGSNGGEPADDRLAAVGVQHRVRRRAADGDVGLGAAHAAEEHPRHRSCTRSTPWKATLGSNEKAKLDAHLDSIRQLENKLAAQRAAAARHRLHQKPSSPPAPTARSSTWAAWTRGRQRDPPELIANAFACDITRVACLQYGNDQKLMVNAPGNGAALRRSARRLHPQRRRAELREPGEVRGVPGDPVRQPSTCKALAGPGGDRSRHAVRQHADALGARHGRRRSTTSSRCASCWRAATTAT